MKPLRGTVWSCALVLVGVLASPVDAAWCNVFQVCWHRQPRPAVSYYAPPNPCCDPCPQPVCTTRYVQRCYYQPVTSYQTRSYYEPVTTYRTSYYYEPVTSYRYSCYYDPCTCNYQQVASPTTSYQLRSQCCPVQSWAQRCCSVPVTSYQQSFYWEPVTTCCTPAAPAPTTTYLLPAQDCPPRPAAAPLPAVTEPRAPATPGVTEYPSRSSSNGLQYDRYYQTPPPPAAGSSYRQVPPRGTLPSQQTLPPAPPPTVKLDRIVAIPSTQVEGQIVSRDKTPRAGAQLLFVSTDQREPRQTVAADQSGKFRVSLTTGGWLVYIQGTDGKLNFHRKLDVGDNETRQVYLVSR